ncbi:AIR carboxylase family protein [bacterium]|nr:MAG: AIR carboxylase family protein [bacterium]
MNLTEIAIVLENSQDTESVRGCKEYLDRFGLRYETAVIEHLANPDDLADFVKKGTDRGIKIFIAVAGSASGLASAIAARTYLPVIGVPLETTAAKGLDALYSMIYLPEGTPVAAMGIGPNGARNAAILAAQILSFSDHHLRDRLLFFKQNGCRF